MKDAGASPLPILADDANTTAPVLTAAAISEGSIPTKLVMLVLIVKDEASSIEVRALFQRRRQPLGAPTQWHALTSPPFGLSTLCSCPIPPQKKRKEKAAKALSKCIFLCGVERHRM